MRMETGCSPYPSDSRRIPNSFAAPRLIMVALCFGWGAKRIKGQVSWYGHYVCGVDM